MGVFPLQDGVLVCGYHPSDNGSTVNGNLMPVNNVASWGTAAPTDESGFVARLFYSAGPPSQSGYTIWQGTIQNWPSERAKLASADANLDGVTNLAAYFFNITPIDGMAETDHEHLPHLLEETGKTYVGFWMREGVDVSNYVVQRSGNLKDWENLAVRPVPVPGVRRPGVNGGDGSVYVKVEVDPRFDFYYRIWIQE